MKREKGKIITITSSKGGVGKTTLLLNLAGIYSKLNKRVLLLDFDFGNGVISLNLNLKTHKNIYHVADDIRNNRYLNYKDYMNNALTSLKEMVKFLAIATTEASNEMLYKKYKNMLDNYSNLQREAYEIMFRKGWYAMEKEESNKIEAKYNVLNEEFISLNR